VKTAPPAPTPGYLDNTLVDFVTMSTPEIKSMCLFFYVWSVVAANSSNSVKDFVQCLIGAVGGGILVPIFLNGTPVPIANELFLVLLVVVFVLFKNVPILREISTGSTTFKLFIAFLSETFRANVVCGAVTATVNVVGTTNGVVCSFPLLAPILCGGLAGCGGGFMPLSKGLSPLDNGLNSKQLTALVGAAFYHVYISTQAPLSPALAVTAGRSLVALSFVFVNFSQTLKVKVKAVKQEEINFLLEN